MQLESERTLAVLQKALWNKGIAEADEALFGEMKAHAVASLAAPVLGELSLTQELLSSWKKYVVQHVYQYQNMLYQQSVLPVSVPYVILKGTSAGRYYPHPEYRAYGDIDIMTRHEDYQAACEELANNGYCEVTNAVDVQVNRHREFERDGIHVEVHYFYAL
nr:nucleotidyltransferase family protein [Clostridiales bacterium]